MTQDMQIQVDSHSDMEYVVKTLSEYLTNSLKEKLFNIDASDPDIHNYQQLLSNELDKMWKHLSPNIHINGMPWNYSTNSLPFEPLKEDLISELSNHQSTFESLLYRLVHYRNTYPSLVKQHLESKYRISDAIPSSARPSSPSIELFNMQPVLMNAQNDIDSLESINASLPKCIDKLDRACSILQEEASRSKSTPPYYEFDAMNEEERKQKELEMRIKFAKNILEKIS